jgi:hypothetical protein
MQQIIHRFRIKGHDTVTRRTMTKNAGAISQTEWVHSGAGELTKCVGAFKHPAFRASLATI